MIRPTGADPLIPVREMRSPHPAKCSNQGLELSPHRRQIPYQEHSWSSRYAFIAVAIFAGIVVALAILLTLDNIISIKFAFERNYNEGWNVYNTERLLHHQIIYDDNYWRVNNYPIVSFLVVAGFNSVFHDLLLSGRLVSLVSFFAVGALAALITRGFGGDRIAAAFGGGCALGFSYLIAPAWIAADDPQMLAEALMLGGFATYVCAGTGRNGLLCAALLVMLGGFCKHNLVAIPLAITIDLALRSPRRLVLWLAACAGLAVGFLGLTKLVAGGDFIGHLLSPRVYIWYNTQYHFMKFFWRFKFPLLVLAAFYKSTFSRQRMLLTAYGIIAIVAGTALAGIEGSSYNMLQDAAVFLAIASGVCLQEVRQWALAQGHAKPASAVIALVAVCILATQPIWARSAQAVSGALHPNRLLATDEDAERAFLADVAYVAKTHGAVICESLLLCYRSGQDFVIDPFNSRQNILAGRLDQSELVRRVAARDFAAIQLRAEICDDAASPTCHILHYPRKFNRFTDEFLYAVDRFYRIDRRSRFGVFYVPK